MAARMRRQLRNLTRRIRLAVMYERLARARRAPIDENSVLYESFSGNGMLCNPEAIFRALLDAPDMDHLRHVWVLSDLGQFASTVAEFADNPRVKFVRKESPAYYSALATSKYLINNATFPPQFGKREGQVYVNTWHGTPLKAMGYDVPGGALDTRNIVRNLVSADYLLAANDATTEMYLTAYRMRNIFRGSIIREGSPRIDRQFVSAPERAQLRSQLQQRGIAVDAAQEIMLYAPTWKGSFYSPTNDISQLRKRIETINSQIDTRKYRLLLKVHQQVYKYAAADKGLRGILVPNEIPANKVLAVTDVLITDYSSIFVDFLATGRPVLFYTPDLDGYTTSRGLYLAPEQWPGPVTRDVDELTSYIKRLRSGGNDDPVVAYAERYAAARERYCAREDGNASARVVDVVFRGRAADYDVGQDFSDGRQSILMHLGGMLSNGITASALSLLDNIDYDRFDVSVTFPHTESPARVRSINLINPNVRLFPRIGGINGSKLKVRSLLAVRGRSARQHEKGVSRHRHLLRDEWVRCFGASRFDFVVDFSGYAPLWVKLFSQRGAGSLSIWLHNDMHAEATNPGRSAWLRASVRAVSALYCHADHLVAVSPALSDVNQQRLGKSIAPDKFTHARNTLNYRRVLHLAYGVAQRDGHVLDAATQAPVEGGNPAATYPGETAEGFHPLDLRDAVDKLMAYHDLDDLWNEVERRRTIRDILPPAPGMRTFVTAGRLSPEKNHERLIRAFDLIHQEDPNTRLVILGRGVLLAPLTQLVDELGLTAAVKLAGYQANPYGVLAHSDCFVLSSDYEGQPVALLEALVLGLPVVTTAFGSVRGALPDGFGRIVPPTVEGLAEGMRSFLRGEIPVEPFDHVAYNRAATEEFYRAIGAA
jgi:CDP-glycerol glycerophosphotransferase (TagB/SpsB family)/glycosyltransferase involved in cell wall biosynthesis